MELNELILALQSSLSSDKEVRTNAENSINKVKILPGYSQGLLKIGYDESLNLNLDIKQLSLVILKNFVKRYWKEPKDRFLDNSSVADNFIINEQDKLFIKENIFIFLCKSSTKQLMGQIEEIIEIIGESEFPSKWNQIIPQIKEGLASKLEIPIIASLNAIYRLSKIYKFKIGVKREPLKLIINEFIPILLNLTSSLDLKDLNEQKAIYLKPIFKTILSSLQMDIPELLRNVPMIESWINIMKAIMNSLIPSDLETFTEDEEEISKRIKFKSWQLKKTVMHILYRMFQKYFFPKYVEQQLREISTYLVKNFSISFLELSINILKKNQSYFIHPSIVYYALKIIGQGIKNEETNPQLFPDNIIVLLKELVFRCLFLTHAEDRKYKEEPIDFVKSQFDIETDQYPRNGASDLIQTACNYVKKSENSTDKKKNANNDQDNSKKDIHPVLYSYLEFISNELNKNSQMSTPNLRVTEAIIFSIGMLSDEIEKNEPLKGQIEILMEQILLPLLRHPVGIIRMRTAWTIGKLSFIELSKPKLKEMIVARLLEMLISVSEEIPVKVNAGISIYPFFGDPEIIKMLESSLFFLLQAFLLLMKLVEIEELVYALEKTVKAFKEKINPYAFGLVKELSDTYRKINTDDNSSPEADLASIACLSTISKIIYLVGKNHKNITSDIEQLVIPLILHTMTLEGSEGTEDGIDILAALTYYCESFSDTLWDFFPILINSCVGTPEEVNSNEVIKSEGQWGFEHFRNIAVCLQNFISKGTARFLTGESKYGKNINLFTNLISRVMEITSKDKSGEIDKIVGIKLLITLFENLKGKIDPLFPNIFNGLLNELNQAKSTNLKSMYFQSILMAIYYSPELSFGLLEQNKISEQFFKALIDFEPNIKYDFECRRILIGLCSGIQSLSFPPGLFSQLFSLLKFAIKICLKEIKNEFEEEESSNNDDDEDIQDDDKYMEALNKINEMHKENEEKEEKEKKENLTIVNKDQGKKNNIESKGQNAKMEEDEDDDDDDDEEDGFFELGKYKIEAADMKLYKSQLEEIDEVILFRDLIFLIKNKNPEVFENFKNSLNKNESDNLALCVAKANEYEKERNEVITN